MNSIFGNTWDEGDDTSILDDVPNNDMLLSSLNVVGYGSRILSDNLGSMFIMMFISFIVLGIIAIIEAVIRAGHTSQVIKVSNKAMTFQRWLKQKYLWNYFIRLFFEGSLGLVFACWFNRYYAGFWSNTTTP